MHTEQRSVRSIAYWNGLCSGRVTRVVLHLQSTVTTLTDTNWLHNAQTRNYTLIATAPVTVSCNLKSNRGFKVYFVLIFIYDTHTLTAEELSNSRGITLHLLLFLHFTKYIYLHWNMFQIADIYGSIFKPHGHQLYRTKFIHSVFCLTTGPKPPPKRCLHTVRSRTSSFKWEYPLLSLMSSSSFLRLLPRLLATSISPFIFPSITCFRRQFLRKMWPIQLVFLFLISCRI